MNEPHTKGNVLLVDDDQFLLDLYSTKFAREGYNIHTCLSPKDAIDVLRSGFVPILFDISMPEQDGFSFLQTLLDEHLAPNSLLIALTNRSTDADKIKAEQLGASRYIVKATMIPAELVATVAEVIAKKGTRGS